jgi:hypothetical protein
VENDRRFLDGKNRRSKSNYRRIVSIFSPSETSPMTPKQQQRKDDGNANKTPNRGEGLYPGEKGKPQSHQSTSHKNTSVPDLTGGTQCGQEPDHHVHQVVGVEIIEFGRRPLPEKMVVFKSTSTSVIPSFLGRREDASTISVTTRSTKIQ